MKIDALHAGADDYVTKPFSAPELIARVHSNIRRHAWTGDGAPVISASRDAVRIDLHQRLVMRDGLPVHLTRL